MVEYYESDSLSPPNGERVGVRGKLLRIKRLNEERKAAKIFLHFPFSIHHFRLLFHMHRLVKQLRQMAGQRGFANDETGPGLLCGLK